MEITRSFGEISGGERKETAKQKKQRTIILELENFDKQLSIHKSELYARKLNEIDAEIMSILLNTHDEFLIEQEALNLSKNAQINDAELFRDLQIEGIEQRYEYDYKLAVENCESQKKLIQEKMMALLEEKKRRILEDRDNIDALEPSRPLPTRKASRLKEREDRNSSKSEDGRREKGSGKGKNRDMAPFIDKILLASEADNEADLLVIRSMMGTPLTSVSVGSAANATSRGRGSKRK